MLQNNKKHSQKSLTDEQVQTTVDKGVSLEEVLLKLKKLKKIEKSEMKQFPPKVEIWVGFEQLLRNLYGKKVMHVSEMSISDWKRLLSKLAKTINLYIRENVVTDQFHWYWLNQALTTLQRAPKHRLYNTEFVLGLIEVIFNLLGHIPDHYWKSSWPRNKKDFILDHYRTLIYRQDRRQKINVIFRTAEFSEDSDLKRYSRELLRQKLVALKSQEKFLEWYRQECPDIYARLF